MKVIDSHIHLFDQQGISRLAWMTPDNKLNGPHTLVEYLKESVAESVIFIETDVRSGPDEDQWDMAIEEFQYVAPLGFLSAIIPWAPIAGGPIKLEKFWKRLQASADTKRVKGFRYLLQNQPPGTMLSPEFFSGLQWLNDKGFAYDLGIDMHSGGLWQLDEWTIVDSKTHGGKYIVNHLGKPDLTNNLSPDLVKMQWLHIAKTTKNEYWIKLSGGFSQMTHELANDDIQTIAAKVRPWLVMFIGLFGADKIMFGSDWPVCSIRVEGAWKKWMEICEILVKELELGDIYYTHIKKAYNL